MSPLPPAIKPPLRHKVFLVLWSAGLASSIGIWMQVIGAAWLMTTLTTSPLMVALVQTAATLPAFLFGLPGGVLADIVDRRRLLLATLAWMAVTVGILCLLTMADALTPWTVLLLTGAIGAASALQAPAWQSAPAEILPRAILPEALALLSMSGNGARALGPALAGVFIAAFGTASVFAATAACFVLSLIAVSRVRFPSRRASDLPPERLLGGMQSGIRYIRHSPTLRGQILRVFASITCAGAVFALLPVIAKNQLALNAGGYGLLTACMGGGAVMGAILIGRLQRRFDDDAMIIAAIVLFAASTLFVAYIHVTAVAAVALVIAGFCWLAMGALPNAAVQTALPAWVRARGVALFLLAFQASQAIGAVVWGWMANHIGASHTLAVTALLLVTTLLYSRHHPLRMGSEAEVTPSMHWAEPVVAVEPDPDDGPVAVEVGYQISPAKRAEFVRAAYALSIIRMRDGAISWRLYRDLSDPTRYVERFVVDSWIEYQRQRIRATLADQLTEEHMQRFHLGTDPPRMLHFIMEPEPAE
jgi:MFS family permease